MKKLKRQYIKRVVHVPSSEWGSILIELIKGFGRWFKQKGLPLDENLVLEYFKQRSSLGGFEDFTDSATDWYLSILEGSSTLITKLQQSQNPVILDVGCGRGGLLVWLLSNTRTGFQYFGVDQDPIAVEACNKHFGSSGTSIRGDIKQTANIFKSTADLIFAINIFPYVASPTEILMQCRDIAHSKDSLLLLVDPSTSLYWEREFGGFGIRLREPSMLASLGSSAGWILQEIVPLALFSILGVPVLNIANLLVFKPHVSELF